MDLSADLLCLLLFPVLYIYPQAWARTDRKCTEVICDTSGLCFGLPHWQDGKPKSVGEDWKKGGRMNYTMESIFPLSCFSSLSIGLVNLLDYSFMIRLFHEAHSVWTFSFQHMWRETLWRLFWSGFLVKGMLGDTLSHTSVTFPVCSTCLQRSFIPSEDRL